MQSGLLNPKEGSGAPRRLGKVLGQSIHPGSESGKGGIVHKRGYAILLEEVYSPHEPTPTHMPL